MPGNTRRRRPMVSFEMEPMTVTSRREGTPTADLAESLIESLHRGVAEATEVAGGGSPRARIRRSTDEAVARLSDALDDGQLGAMVSGEGSLREQNERKFRANRLNYGGRTVGPRADDLDVRRGRVLARELGAKLRQDRRSTPSAERDEAYHERRASIRQDLRDALVAGRRRRPARQRRVK